MPCVLALSGLDPTGGAGLSADIETMAAIGVNALPVATLLSVQNTTIFDEKIAVANSIIAKQISCLVDDINFEVIKIGLLADIKQIIAITDIIRQYNKLTVVLDPIIKSSNNNKLLDNKAIIAMCDLIKLCDIISPNFYELQTLGANKSEQIAVNNLNTNWLLLTKTDSSKDIIAHKLYYKNKAEQTFKYKKIDGNFHGSGCTLSAAIAGYIAQGLAINKACEAALDYTYSTLLVKHKIGKMQFHPQRIKL